ncbi:FAD-binding oxidoreductase [Agromyces aerolatus]|uniref:FAD-binding oxidoreductase n=1 Tax=Agromyces sp. LY-1074 TaxID=3074080 RepID=UPI002858A52C|nr:MULTISPECIES: FAD-binding oxidoreductase [unclassified Agromyces]MDR5699577.1 FAD-binding oxidoreductase [Agromyces sp. LY-1074]MDR5705873.1 FAD-binding oxidoreductase [Agromyces sp. LY-1358]
MARTPDRAALERLRDDLSGTLVLDDDPGYDVARLPWNLSVDQRPAAVATPADLADVQAIVRAAADGGFGVTTQPNGHGAEGSLEGVVLIRPSRFDELSVDTEARVLRAGAGVNWGRALQELDGTGFIALAGSNPEVNVVGLALNGGHSMFSRRYGITARSIVAVELVDGEGEVRRVTDAEDPELIWALRGGGGLFGVVTAIELALYPGDQLFGGTLAFPIETAATVHSAAVELARDIPELGIELGLARFPDLPLVPPPLRGRTVATVALVHLGDEVTGRRYADRLISVAEPIADTLTVFTIGSLAAVAAEPVDPMPTVDFGAAVGSLDDAFIHDLVDAFLRGADLGLARLGVRVLGGAIAEELGAELAAIGAIESPALLSAGVLLMDPSIDAMAALQPLRELAATYPAAGAVPSFLGRGATLADAFAPAVLARLAEVKRRVDPRDVIVGNRELPAG